MLQVAGSVAHHSVGRGSGGDIAAGLRDSSHPAMDPLAAWSRWAGQPIRPTREQRAAIASSYDADRRPLAQLPAQVPADSDRYDREGGACGTGYEGDMPGPDSESPPDLSAGAARRCVGPERPAAECV